MRGHAKPLPVRFADHGKQRLEVGCSANLDQIGTAFGKPLNGGAGFRRIRNRNANPGIRLHSAISQLSFKICF